MEPPPRDKLGGDPIESAGLFEGDIAGVSADMVKGRKGITVSAASKQISYIASLHKTSLESHARYFADLRRK